MREKEKIKSHEWVKIIEGEGRMNTGREVIEKGK